jgi:hypothetical protein
LHSPPSVIAFVALVGGVWAVVLFGAEIQRALARTRKILADGWLLAQARGRWHPRELSSQFAHRLRGPSLDSARERLAEARWHAEQSSSDLGTRLRAFRAEHGRASSAAAIGLLLGLTLAGIGAAVLAEGGDADIVGVNYTSRYVTVTGPSGTQTYAVTVTTPGKRTVVRVQRTRVRRRVVTGPGGVSTVLRSVAVPGSGQTKTVAGPTKTITVTGPSQTVTQAVTEVVTSVVTVTETVPKNP